MERLCDLGRGFAANLSVKKQTNITCKLDHIFAVTEVHSTHDDHPHELIKRSSNHAQFPWLATYAEWNSA